MVFTNFLIGEECLPRNTTEYTCYAADNAFTPFWERVFRDCPRLGGNTRLHANSTPMYLVITSALASYYVSQRIGVP